MRVALDLVLLLSFILENDGASTLMSKFREHQQYSSNKDLQQQAKWSTSVPHMLQDVLVSIDDKLRSLDTFSYSIKLGKLDFSLEQLVRRLENIETKLSRMETKFDVRMEKVEEVVIGKDLKEEFSNEHMIRRIENLNDKFNTKTSFLDAKIDIRMDRMLNKLETLERDLHSATDDILEKLIKTEERQIAFETEVLEKLSGLDTKAKQANDLRLSSNEEFVNALNQRLDKLQNQTASSLNNLEGKLELVLREMKLMQSNFQKSQMPDSRLRSILDDYGTTNNQAHRETTDLINNLSTIIHKTLKLNEVKFRELNSDVELYTKKIVGGMEDLWRSSDEVRSHLYDAVQQGNKTREIVRREFNKLHEQITPLPMIEPRLADVSVNLDQKLSELGVTVDNSFATLLVAQNTFIDTCRRIQQDESQIYETLEKVIYEMRNRSELDMEWMALEMKNQNRYVSKNLEEILFAVLTAGNETVNRVLEFLISKQNLGVYRNGCEVEGKEQDSFQKADKNIEALIYDVPVPVAEKLGRKVSAKPNKELHGSLPEAESISEQIPNISRTNITNLGVDYDADYQIGLQETEYQE